MIIPALPELVQVAKESYPEYDLVSVNHLSGALLSTFLGLGQCLGPLYGAAASAKLGFRPTEDYLALFCMVFGIVYFAVCNGTQALRETCGKNESINP